MGIFQWIKGQVSLLSYRVIPSHVCHQGMRKFMQAQREHPSNQYDQECDHA